MGKYYHLELRHAGTNTAKFYRLIYEGDKLFSIWGRIGSSGQGNRITFATTKALERTVASTIRSKRVKGYQIVEEGTLSVDRRYLTPERGEKQAIGEAERLAFDSLIQNDASQRRAAVLEGLKLKSPEVELVKIGDWGLWESGWEWKVEVKKEILKQPHYYRKDLDLLVVVLDSASVAAMRKISQGRFFIWDPRDLEGPDLKGVRVDAPLIETAAMLWEPHNKDSQYQCLSDAFEAAQALLG